MKHRWSVVWIMIILLSSVFSPIYAQNGTVGTITQPLEQDPVFVGAGDIAGCDSGGDEATAGLIQQIIADAGRGNVTVFTAGDNVYPNGTDAEFADCYAPSWGQFKDITRPTSGNHDCNTPGCSGYYNYFGSAAGDPAKGYYSYTIGSWDIYALNSQCTPAGGCGPTSPMVQWLQQSLTDNPNQCILAYWHDPTSNSGQYGNIPDMLPAERVLYEHGADVILAGHAHHYERFLPQSPDGLLDWARGIIKFIVGFGGKDHGPNGPNPDGTYPQIPNSDAFNNKHFGVLKLILGPDRFTWEAVSVPASDGSVLTDSGSSLCVRENIATPTSTPTPSATPTATPTPINTPTPTSTPVGPKNPVYLPVVRK